MPDQKGKKLADALFGQPEEQAAFGVFPQMKPRRSKQDPEAAKDVPRQLLRGWAAGTLGLPGDIEGLIRMLPGLDETPRLPTSEFYLDYLPGKAEGESGKAAAGLGTLFGGLGSTKIARGALEAGKGAQRLAERAAAMPSPSGLAAQRGVVKMPGGNWLTGSVEKGVAPLKANRPNADEELRKARELFTPEYKSGMSPEAVARLENETLPRLEKEVALNKWIDSNLTNYIKKQMATPDDPVRKLAEEGISHRPLTPYSYETAAKAGKKREVAGGGRYGKSQLAKQWEDESDVALNTPTVGQISLPIVVERNPWLKKLDPNERVYAVDNASELGFDHIVDVLREDLAAGRIRPEQLNKVSMEQAVRRTYEYDQEMAKKMAEAKIKATEGMPVYKEYPEGYKWVELTRPEPKMEGLKSEYLPEVDMWRIVDENGGVVSSGATEKEAIGLLKREEREKALEDALTYEGETMGHCVGGYCPDVLEGRSRIYSLRDAKGEPHVTIEVQPAAEHRGFGRGGQRPPEEDYYRLQEEWLEGNRNGTIDPNLTFAEWWRSTQGLPEDKRPPQIVQIKGKQNLAPKEDYLPYVQDFVRSGQWSDVGDLRNTGLYRADPEELGMFIPEDPRLRNLPGRRTEDLIKAKEAGLFGDQKYLTRQEWEDILRRQIESESGPLPPLEGMKRGGKVSFSDNPDTMRLELAGGGAVKALKALVKGEKKAAVPVDIPRVRPTQQDIIEAAERVGRQQLGEHVTNPLTAPANLAGRAVKEAKRLKDLEYKLKPAKPLPKEEVYQPKIGEVNIALPGDQTIADMILESIGDVEIGSLQQGGAKYGLGRLSDPEEYRAFWASNQGAAQNFQNKVDEIARQFDTDQVTAQHLAMGLTSNDFAQHFADANMRAIDYSKMNKRQMEIFDSHIAAGYTKKNPKTGEKEQISFPDWPGISNPEAALEAMKNNSELRKWFNNRMKTQDLTTATNMPDGRAIQWAITEPLIRNSEINLTGMSVGRMKPGAELIPNAPHETYSHDIAGTALGRAPELAPFEISFPDVTSFVREKYRPQDFTGTIQKVFPHQIVDEAYLEDMQKYYEQLRKVRGFKDGGKVKKTKISNNPDTMRLELMRKGQ